MRSDSKRAWIWTTLGIAVGSIVLRLALNFSTTYPPATDAAYYPMQTLYWFAHGRLMYNDLPLLFWMNIGLTWLLTVLGQSLDAAALFASRLLDSVLEPWIAVVIMIAGYVWSQGQRQGLIPSAASALLVTISSPILRLLSDFQKNSLGLVWMAAALWMCRLVMLAPTPQRWFLLGIFVLLSALTHIGTFAVTIVLVALPLLIWCWRSRRSVFLRILGAGAILFAFLLGTLYIFDGRRAFSILRSPIDVFLTGPLEFPSLPIIIATMAIILLALRRSRRDRETIARSDRAFVTGLCAALVLLILPKHLEYHGRLLLMAPVPAVFLILFLLTRRALAGRSPWPAFLILLLAIVPLEYSIPSRGPMMNEQAAAEMREVREQIRNPEKTLVVAPHGLEWWAGYFLGTPVSMRKPEVLDTRYERLLLVRNIEALGPLPGPIAPQPLPLPAQRIYKGKTIEVFDVLQGGRSTTTDTWTGRIQLEPDKALSFAAELDLRAKPPFGFFVVGDERIPIPEVSLAGSALVLNFSEYGAEMRGTLDGTSWTGQYLRHRADETRSFDFSATKGLDTNPAPDDSVMPMGPFKVRFEDETEKTAVTSAKFWKKDETVLGTFIAPDGDYGLFEGVTTKEGNASFHRFTGWQAMLLELHSKGDRWTGTLLAASNAKPRNFTLEPSPDPLVVRETRMKNPSAAFEFSCQSSAGLDIRNTDLRFRGKAMIVDIMGTWCHNCLDEAPVLQELKKRFGEKLEIVGLSFELTNDAPLAVKNLGLFKERFAITYPLLFCGDLDEANVDAQLRKQLDNFFAYPTSLFIDATGKVRTIHSGFKGPGTGDEFQRQVALFHELAEAIISGGERR